MQEVSWFYKVGFRFPFCGLPQKIVDIFVWNEKCFFLKNLKSIFHLNIVYESQSVNRSHKLGFLTELKRTCVCRYNCVLEINLEMFLSERIYFGAIIFFFLSFKVKLKFVEQLKLFSCFRFNFIGLEVEWLRSKRYLICILWGRR